MQEKLYIIEKTTDSETQGRKKRVLRRHNDLTVSNKVPSWDKCPPFGTKILQILEHRGGKIKSWEGILTEQAAIKFLPGTNVLPPERKYYRFWNTGEEKSNLGMYID